MIQKLRLSENPVPKGDSFQIFLLYNGLQNKFNWDDPAHVDLWASWTELQPTFNAWQPMPISPNNGGFNHYN